jgi:aspartyl-tRNA synthetase
MYRSHTCGALRMQDVNQQVTLAGWVQTIRKFGAITFIDLRDRYGITQLLLGEELNSQLTDQPLGREYVLQATGKVTERSNKNSQIETGDIEVAVTSFTILNKSAVPPFTIQDDTDGGDDIRMKYRFLDLRRNAVKKNLELRYAVNRSARNYLHQQGFMDIETPFLIKSTPEGARDFVVPSRMNAGQFYALPQSPQTFKQLLMVSGYDRYYQIVKCFRDEDLRADRQPEFTQIDCEMAFVEQEDILQMFEQLIKQIFKDVKQIDYTDLVEPLSLDEAYLDVTENKKGNPSATLIAQEIRKRIFDEVGLTASAGISVNKFVAKIASDYNKPNGQKTVNPEEVEAFLEQLDVKKFYGIGKVTAEKMYQLGIFTGFDLKQKAVDYLEQHFGNSGLHYFQIVRGIHESPVKPNRKIKSIGAERTFNENLSSEIYLEERLQNIAKEIEQRLQKSKIAGKTITLKIKYSSTQYGISIRNIFLFNFRQQ